MSIKSRFKRYNVFPHLVAADLTFGIEHTPVDKLKFYIDGNEPPTSPRDPSAPAGTEQRKIIDEAINPPEKPLVFNKEVASTIGVSRLDKSSLKIWEFPRGLGSNMGIPYVLFKIFETQTGPMSSISENDATSISLREGTSAVASALAGIPGATAAAAAVFGGQAAGAAGAIGAAFATTETGQGAIDVVGRSILGNNVGSITSRAKDLLKGFALKRNINQFKEAIALFMPDGVTTNYDHEYDALSVTATLGAAGFAAQALSSRDGAVEATNPYIMEAAASLASKVIGNEDFAKLGLFATTGMVRNPQMEMIYSSPVLRRFTFDFRLVPRNRDEAVTIQEVIRELKRYSAPIIQSGTGGRFLTPPAQFEIEFYDGKSGSNPNKYLFKTKNCVLTGLSLDYSPNGFATFKDGAPVETRMQLTFQETVIIDRKAVEEGY